MPLFRDQTGFTADIPSSPSRILSLVPSQTELLADLLLDDRVAGITKFCIHPNHWFRHKTRVGGTKNLNLDLIRQLNPDLILANREENTREQIEELRTLYPVWTSDIAGLPQALKMIEQVGLMTQTIARAADISKNIQLAIHSLPAFAQLRACYLIWEEPYMTVGGDTFINDMMRRCGLQNIFADSSRYPETNAEEITDRKPDIVLLSSEPFPFAEKHLTRWKQEFPAIPACLADGEMFSWYGSRLLQSPSYFINLRKAIDALI